MHPQSSHSKSFSLLLLTFCLVGSAYAQTVTLTLTPGQGGLVAKSPDAASYDSGTNVTLSTVPRKGQTKTLDLGGGEKLELVYIPAGTFQMGSHLSPSEIVSRYGGKEESFTSERPLHTVEVDGFYMGKFEVTNAQYRRYKSRHTNKDYKENSLDGDSQPVVFVSWNDAKGFCEWLSQRTGETVRLPYEAEWEYAARAGTETVRFWGDDDRSMGQYANTYDQTGKREFNFSWDAADTDDRHKVTAPVGNYRPNAFGLYDMIGNVWEWCEDYYDKDYYSNSPRKNPTGASSVGYRVLRGGCWYYIPFYCRSASRIWFDPTNSGSLIGFRIVCIFSRKSQ